ncbi:hypothetical protein [Mesorhizobium carmichaelinearum]|uniref:hypothetical protein n=1 Tax=Mesorhizobium carmichaelinearum TaxID=1208188 RepID=UPI0034E0D301
MTNAVKHFKFEPRGKRRLHLRPNVGEIQRCKWWLDQEPKPVAPAALVAMGASAVRSLFGRPVPISSLRGIVSRLENDLRCLPRSIRHISCAYAAPMTEPVNGCVSSAISAAVGKWPRQTSLSDADRRCRAPKLPLKRNNITAERADLEKEPLVAPWLIYRRPTTFPNSVPTRR